MENQKIIWRGGDFPGSYKLDSGLRHLVEDITNCISSREMISLTYEELIDLIGTDNLAPGVKYLLADYRSSYFSIITNERFTGEVEGIVVTATSVKTISPIAFSIAHPEDILIYDFSHPDGITGLITRRIDTKLNNDIAYDFRGLRFPRYQINVTTTHADGNASFPARAVIRRSGTNEIYIKLRSGSHLFTNADSWLRLPFDNLSFISNNSSEMSAGGAQIPVTSNFMYFNAFSSHAGPGAMPVYGANVTNNKIASASRLGFESIFFSNQIRGNTIGLYFDLNVISFDFDYNSIEETFAGNIIGHRFIDNYIYSDFSENIVALEFINNTIHRGFNQNNVSSGFSENFIEKGFYSNFIGVGFTNNVICADLGGNTVMSSFKFNTIFGSLYDRDFSSATLVYTDMPKTITLTQSLTPVLTYYNAAGALTVVSIFT